MRIYGNEQLQAFISDAAENGTLSHTYIISGAAGSGKHTIALFTAAALSPEYVKKIDAGNCPDIIYINSGDNRKSIGVDSIRSVRSRASLSPNELDYKMFIIEDAQTMTVQAQNALLKLLEEPPRDVYILLLCENTTGLLPTVLSRSPVLKTQVFSEEELSDYLLENEKKASALKERDAEAYRRLIMSSGGSIGTAKKLLSARSAGADSEDKAYNFLKLLGSREKAEFVLFVSGLTSKRDELDAFFDGLEKAVRDVILYNSATKEVSPVIFHDSPVIFHDKEKLHSVADKFTGEDLCRLAEETISAHERLDLNVNIKLTLIQYSRAVWNAVY